MNVRMLLDESLAPYTTLKVGGAAAYLIEVQNESELQEAVAFAQEKKLEIHILGGGSNLLIADEGVKGAVIKIELRGMSVLEESDTSVLITAGAGEELDDVVAFCVEHGWWGMENLSHIPGTVGATPVQNVGAYGVEVKDIIAHVRVYNMKTHAFEELTAAQCAFGYRDSIFKSLEDKEYIVTAVTFKLSAVPSPHLSYRDLQDRFKDGDPTIAQIRKAVIDIRSQKFPNWHKVGTAGSFFKNPTVSKEKFQELLAQYPELPGYETSDGRIKLSLGWILDKILNKKGYKEGSVGTYQNQALVLVASEDATAQEIKIFAQNIIDEISSKLGVTVEWEVSQM